MHSDDNVRSKLLELAIAIIDESGEAAVRTNHLVEQAGVKAPTLYHYFGSREGLIEEAQAERFSRYIREDVDALIALVDDCNNKTELKKAIMSIFSRRDDDNGVIRRRQRMNALGSAYARPHLETKISRTLNEEATRGALALAPFQQKGMIAGHVDLRSLVAWYMGASLGKNLVELSESDVNVANWEKLMNSATLHLLFDGV